MTARAAAATSEYASGNLVSISDFVVAAEQFKTFVSVLKRLLSSLLLEVALGSSTENLCRKLFQRWNTRFEKKLCRYLCCIVSLLRGYCYFWFWSQFKVLVIDIVSFVDSFRHHYLLPPVASFPIKKELNTKEYKRTADQQLWWASQGCLCSYITSSVSTS